MFVQTGGIVSSNIYRADDAPRYVRGNKVLLAICVLNMGVYVGTRAWYAWRNKRRDEQWRGMSEVERKAYLEGTTDEGNRRLDFRFAK